MKEKIIYGIGPDSFTSIAMDQANKEHCEGEAKLVYLDSNEQALKVLFEAGKSLDAGSVDSSKIIVIPTYNSSGGNVILEKGDNYTQEVYDMFRILPGLFVMGQVDVSIEQTLGYSGEISDLHRIISNPNALKQTAESITRINNERTDKGMEVIEVFECGSTAEGLNMAREDISTAGIGSKKSALEFGLRTLRMADPTITYMNLIHPAGERLGLEYIINKINSNNRAEINNLNTVMVEITVPNYQYSLYDMTNLFKELKLDMRAMSIRNNGINAMTMLVDIHKIEGNLLGLFRELNKWKQITGGVIKLKGAYNSSTWVNQSKLG